VNIILKLWNKYKHEEYCLLGCYIMQSRRSSMIHFWGIHCLYLQVCRSLLLIACFASLNFHWWRRRLYVPLKCQSPYATLHGITSQKIAFFIVTTVRTGNFTSTNTEIQHS
jgi:hypothetical protein